MSAIAYGFCDVSIDLLKNYSPNPWIEDWMCKTALHLIVIKGHKINTEDPKNYERFTSEYNQLLMKYHQDQRLIMYKILKNSEILKNINRGDIYGNTSFNYTCTRRDIEYINLWIEAGANIEIKNNTGMTSIEILDKNEFERLALLVAASRSREIFYKSSISTCYLKINIDDEGFGIKSFDNFESIQKIFIKIIDREFYVYEEDPNKHQYGIISIESKNVNKSTEELKKN